MIGDPQRDRESFTIRHHVAGGGEHGGGIGRLVGYVLQTRGARARHMLLDTRGPRWSPLRSPFRLLAAMAQVSASALRQAPIVEHLHIAGRGSTARKLVLGTWSRWMGSPYVLHLHDYDYAQDYARRPPWQQALIRRLFQQAAQIIALGQRDAGFIEQRLQVPSDRISVLRNCVPEPRPRDEPGETSGEAGAEILFLGTLGPRKGVPELLQALAAPTMATRAWHAVLAGDGDNALYRNRAHALGLSGRIDFPGWLAAQEAAALRARADILVLPSHGEGFAMAVLEGLAAGLAVVTTPVGAHDEVLVNGQNCLLVPPGDVPALADALQRLVDDPRLRRRIAAEGHQLYRTLFTMDGYLRRLEALDVQAVKPHRKVEVVR